MSIISPTARKTHADPDEVPRRLDLDPAHAVVDKEHHKAHIKKLKKRLAYLQRQVIALKIPVAIVFEGWNAAGKGTLMNELLLRMDPRGYKVHKIKAPYEEEYMRPWLWRFWRRIPANDEIAIYDSSWYRRVLRDRVEGDLHGKKLKKSFEEIRNFERHLTDDGAVIIKLFLHISKAEQKARFKKLESNPATKWRVTEHDWKTHDLFEDFVEASERMFVETDTVNAPWHVVLTHDRRFAELKIFNTVIEALEEKLAVRKKYLAKVKKRAECPVPEYVPGRRVLDQLDLTKALTKEEYKPLLKKYQKRIYDIMHQCYEKRVPVVIVYEGVDAGGKGGNIRRLVADMDPRGYEVVPIGAPTEDEKAHHYLWRFWTRLPKDGHFAIFDRSWYGRVLVERIEGFCEPEEWQRAYQEINEFEKMLHDHGSAIFKFWIHIDKDEQLYRFRRREQRPDKRWKITEEDWRNREKWGRNMNCAHDMLLRTDTKYAPWTVVEGNSKKYARIKALRTVIDGLEKRLEKA